MRAGANVKTAGTYELSGVTLVVAGSITLIGILINPLTTASVLFHTFGYLMYGLPIYLLWLGYTLFSARYTRTHIIQLLRSILSFPTICWSVGSIELLVRFGTGSSAMLSASGRFGLLPVILFSSFTAGYGTLILSLAIVLASAVFVLFHTLRRILGWVFLHRKLSRKPKKPDRRIPAARRPALLPFPEESGNKSSMDTRSQEEQARLASPPSAEEPSSEDMYHLTDEKAPAVSPAPAYSDNPLPVSILPEAPPARNLGDEDAQQDLQEIEQTVIDVVQRLTQIRLVRAPGREPFMGISSLQLAFRPHESNRKAVRGLLNLTYDLGLELGRSPIRISIKDVILVEVPLNHEERTYVYVKELLTHDESKPEPTYLIGRTMDGQALELPVKKSLNVLIGGQVGTGKSVLLHTIIFGIIFRWKPSEVQLALYDHKVEEFKRYARLPHLWHPVADNPRTFEAMLEKLEQELERRKRVREKDEHARFPLLVIIMDEFRGLSSERLMTLISECRSLNMTFVLATQYPRADVISTPIKANLTTGISFRMRDATGSRLILGESGGEMLLDNGDCLVSTSFCFEHAQAALCRKEDLQAVGEYLRNL